MGWETWYEKTTFDTAVLSICRSKTLQEGNSMLPWQKLGKNITIYGHQKRRKNSMKMIDFSWMGTSRNQIKNRKLWSTQKNQLVLNPRSKKYITRPNDELWRIQIFQKIHMFCGFRRQVYTAWVLLPLRKLYLFWFKTKFMFCFINSHLFFA